jgi:hypothetical protein
LWTGCILRIRRIVTQAAQRNDACHGMIIHPIQPMGSAPEAAPSAAHAPHTLGVGDQHPHGAQPGGKLDAVHERAAPGTLVHDLHPDGRWMSSRQG